MALQEQTEKYIQVSGELLNAVNKQAMGIESMSSRIDMIDMRLSALPSGSPEIDAPATDSPPYVEITIPEVPSEEIPPPRLIPPEQEENEIPPDEEQAPLSSTEDGEIKEVISEDEPEQSVSPVHHDDPEVIPDPSLPTPHDEEITAPGKDGKIQITPEIRQQIISHLDALKTSGMNDARITKAAGLPSRSLISLIRRAENDPKRQQTIKPEQYQALMSVTPITS